MNMNTQENTFRRGSLEIATSGQSAEHPIRRGSRCCDRGGTIRKSLVRLSLIAALVLIAGGCSEQANMAGRSSYRLADSGTAHTSDIQKMSDEELDQAIMSPFTTKTYEQSRKRQWVRETGYGVSVALDNHARTKKAIADNVK